MRHIRSIALALLCISVAMTGFMPQADAQRRISIIRDAEVEALMRTYASPILGAAGLGGSNIEIIIVNDTSFNAFVADARRIFINIGTILEADTPGEVIGVLAHETGHLRGNHLIRLREQISRAQVLSAIAMIAGAATVAAGASAGSGDAARAGAGIVSGGQEAVRRSLLAYQRTEELAADSAALTYLDRAGISGRGLIRTFERFQDQSMFSSRYVDPYVLSHPMARDRLARISSRARQSRHFDKKDSPSLQLAHELVQAKIIASIRGSRSVANIYKSDDKSLPAIYARAISASRQGRDLRVSLRLFDQLIKQQPNNPFFWEAKGSALFENGRPADASKAFARAAQLAPQSGLIRILYGAALVETGKNNNLREAIKQIENGLSREPSYVLGYRFLGQAYARTGNEGQAALNAAYEAFFSGNLPAAKTFATRAQRILPRGSPGWLRADDILSFDQG